jgi:hypothetical protein
MVPGEFNTEIPFFKANPLRGRTWHSNPTGISRNNPVFTNALSMGLSSMGSVVFARTSNPAEAIVS